MKLARRPAGLAWIVAGLGFGAGLPAWAGTAEVRLVDPGQFADAGNSPQHAKGNMEELGRHFQALAKKHLPPDQKVVIDVLDVDIAGSVSAQGGRVTRGKNDFPRMKLRYALEAPGQPPRTGEDLLSDPDYERGLSQRKDSVRLYFEKRMIDEWFVKTFVKKS